MPMGIVGEDLMVSDNGTDEYDSSEKQRVPAWTGESSVLTGAGVLTLMLRPDTLPR